jgi:hypothetical protein
VYQAGGAHVDAFSSALHDSGYDTCAYELSTALAVALQDPQARSRFAAKRKPFATLTGNEVESEFL